MKTLKEADEKVTQVLITFAKTQPHAGLETQLHFMKGTYADPRSLETGQNLFLDENDKKKEADEKDGMLKAKEPSLSDQELVTIRY
ncbi:MAG: hypothetical protein M1835_006885 [Candelina submexicana]|nr:MAG: hypothetical protein M1835_006885 [Candelina submexicana]